jgi:antitoxin YefM
MESGISTVWLTCFAAVNFNANTDPTMGVFPGLHAADPTSLVRVGVGHRKETVRPRNSPAHRLTAGSQELVWRPKLPISYARQNLAKILETAEASREPVILMRRGREDMALISAGELRSLEETAHLLRSPKNAQRLLSALQRALSGAGNPATLAELREELGVEKG